MRYIPRALLAGGLGFAVAVLVAACGGSSGLLSAGQAGTLNGQLAAVASAINSGACQQAGAAAQTFDNAVSNLPSSVNATLTNNLKQASGALAQQAEPDCQAGTTQSIPTTTKTTSTPTKSTPTKSTPTTASTTTTTATNTNTTKTATGPTTSSTPATTGTSQGSTTTTGGSGGAPVGGTGTSTSGSGGAPTGNGNGQ